MQAYGTDQLEHGTFGQHCGAVILRSWSLLSSFLITPFIRLVETLGKSGLGLGEYWIDSPLDVAG